MMTGVLLTGALSVLLLGIPTKGRSLEDIEATEFGEPDVPSKVVEQMSQ
jgi:MFS transporter, putative metabolite:H+ symporter